MPNSVVSTKGKQDEWTQCCSVLNKLVAFFFFSGSLSLADDTTYENPIFSAQNRDHKLTDLGLNVYFEVYDLFK